MERGVRQGRLLLMVLQFYGCILVNEALRVWGVLVELMQVFAVECLCSQVHLAPSFVSMSAV